MKLTRADVSPISNMSARQFADWLQAGFEDIATGETARLMKAFEPLHLIVTRRQSIVDDLEAVHDALGSAKTQSKFRKGLSSAFYRLAIQSNQSEALRSILALAQRIHAADLTNHIVPMVLNTGSCDHDPSLFRHAFDYLAVMAPLPAAKKAILALVSSVRFDPNFSIYAFIALCRCDPSRWIEHLSQLRPYIVKVRASGATHSTLLTAKRLISLVPLSNVAEHILHLEISRVRARPVQGDNWLAEALFLGPRAPLKVTDVGGGWLALSKSAGDGLTVKVNDVKFPNPETINFLKNVKDGPVRSVEQVVERLHELRNAATKTPEQIRCIDSDGVALEAWARIASKQLRKPHAESSDSLRI